MSNLIYPVEKEQDFFTYDQNGKKYKSMIGFDKNASNETIKARMTEIAEQRWRVTIAAMTIDRKKRHISMFTTPTPETHE